MVVAPDDGTGGRIALHDTYYSPDGASITGDVGLMPGEALILSKSHQREKFPDFKQFKPRELASWEWKNSQLIGTTEGERFRLAALPPALLGEHDLLLDSERSLAPYERLEINARLMAPGASVLVIAEVDDPQKKQKWAIVAVESPDLLPKPSPNRKAVYFRSSPRLSEEWPLVSIVPLDGRQPLTLDGPGIFAASGYTFRRWSHARLMGPIEIASIKLTQRPKRMY